MRLGQAKKFDGLYTALAFVLPVLGFFGVMIARGFIPFGSTSMLYSDMYHQYYPFFVSFRRALLSGDSLLYNWDVGMGMDYLGLIAYYLASPLNLLSVLIPESLTLEFFSLLVPIKIGFAGLFFGIFLKKLFRKSDLSISLFGCFYALCAWSLGYHWNVMWLDTFALLPLVILGEVYLLRDRKFLLYTIALFLSVAANYYIGLFTCIFVALIFFCYEICRWSGFKKFITGLGRMILFSVLAIGMTAFLELPAYAALQTTQSSVNNFPSGMRLNIADANTWAGLFDAMRQVAGNMNGGLVPNYVSHSALPNIYCGVISVILSFLFLTSRQVKLRDKICAVVMLLFLNVSFIVRQLDYMWHGFHFTNMIPYRFSFLYSFVLLYMAYRAYLLRREFQLWQVITGVILTIGILLCSEPPRSISFWLFNIVLLLLYFAAFIYPHLYLPPKKNATEEQKRLIAAARSERRRISGYLLCGIMGIELILNLVNFGVDFTGTIITDYPKGKEYSASMIQYMNERSANEIFFRAEATHTQTLNDGALNGYHGITTFTSSANVRITRFMQALGFGAKDTYNRYSYEDSSPVANLFLNLRYMIDRQGANIDNSYFDDIHHYGNVHLLENKAYLPLGFLASPQLLNADFETAYSALSSTGGNWNRLDFQNKLFRAATGIEKDPWEMIVGNHLSISGEDLTVSTSTQSGSCEYNTDPQKGGTVVYKYIANKTGYMCLDLYIGLWNSSYNAKNSYSIWKNGVELYNDKYSLPQTAGVADVAAGDVVELRISCYGNEHGLISVHAGILDDAVFADGYDVLSASKLKLTTFKNTFIEGTIDCDRSGVLYTSIPQNGNWIAMVDGQMVETVTIGDAMVGLLLSKGSHTVSFLYRNNAFRIGLVVSIVCLLILIVIYLLSLRKRPRGKYEADTQLAK